MRRDAAAVAPGMSTTTRIRSRSGRASASSRRSCRDTARRLGRSASIGLSFAARVAGYQPKKMPIDADTAKATITALTVTLVSKPIAALAASRARCRARRRCRSRAATASAPRAGTGGGPPTRLAPIAMRMPISRVRSVTDTSMMFMMPMPPTIEADRPDRGEQQRDRRRRRRQRVGHRGQVVDGEVVGRAGVDPVDAAEQGRDAVADRHRGCRRRRPRRRSTRIERRKALLCSWRSAVVSGTMMTSSRSTPPKPWPRFAMMPMTVKLTPLMRTLRAHRVVRAEQFVGDGVADERDARAGAVLHVAERAAGVGAPVVDDEIGRRRADRPSSPS